jgi:hypothetical protein
MIQHTMAIHRGLCIDAECTGCDRKYESQPQGQPMAEWLKDPTNQQTHKELQAALAAGTIQVQGAAK